MVGLNTPWWGQLIGIFLAAAASGDTCNASITTAQPLIIVIAPHLHQSLSNVLLLGLNPRHHHKHATTSAITHSSGQSCKLGTEVVKQIFHVGVTNLGGFSLSPSCAESRKNVHTSMDGSSSVDRRSPSQVPQRLLW